MVRRSKRIPSNSKRPVKKYDVVFFDLIFGQTASWKWPYDLYIIASLRSKIAFNVAALEMSLILYF